MISIFRHDEAKIVEKAEFTNVNEHFEIIFNAGMAEKTTHANASNRIININKLMLYIKLFGQMLTQRLHTTTLCCMMSCGKIVNA